MMDDGFNQPHTIRNEVLRAGPLSRSGEYFPRAYQYSSFHVVAILIRLEWYVGLHVYSSLNIYYTRSQCVNYLPYNHQWPLLEQL